MTGTIFILNAYAYRTQSPTVDQVYHLSSFRPIANDAYGISQWLTLSYGNRIRSFELTTQILLK
jgi:hypothetical protein